MSPVEIACDESGSEGENLVGGETDVFAHAGVRLTPEAAAACVREIRRRIGSPAEEYKANHLLRAKHRAVLEWLLDPAGPLAGHGHVHLTDKTLFAVRAAVTLLAEDGTDAMARTLHRTGPAAFGTARWEFFLAAFTSVLRLKPRRGVTASPAEFFALADELAAVPGEAGEIVARFRGGADARGGLPRPAGERPELRAGAGSAGARGVPHRPPLERGRHAGRAWCTTNSSPSLRNACCSSRPPSATGWPASGSSTPAPTRGCRSPTSSPGSPAGSPPTRSTPAATPG